MSFLGTRERLLYLRTLPLFGSLPAEELATLGSYMEERAFVKGELLLADDEPMRHVDLIVEGEVQVSRLGRPIRIFGPRTPVGVLGLLAETTEGVRVQATRDGISLRLEHEALLDLCEDSYAVLLHLLRMMTATVIEERRQAAGTGGLNNPVAPSEPRELPPPLDLVQRMVMLQSTMTFAQSNVSGLAQLARRVQERRFEAGQRLWHEGDPSGSMYTVVQGLIRCETESGQQFGFEDGGAAGVLDSMAGIPRWFGATAEVDTVVLELTAEDFFDVLEDSVDLAMELLRVLSIQVVELLDDTLDVPVPRESMPPPVAPSP